MVNLLKRKLPETALNEMYENILHQGMMLNKTKTGTLQIINNKEHSLEIVYSAGVSKKFVDHFKIVEAGDGSVCGRALKNGQSIYVSDLTQDESFVPHLKIALHDGIRAVQSTPLISKNGKVIGILSTHFKLPKKLSKTELTLFENFCQKAADNIEEVI